MDTVSCDLYQARWFEIRMLKLGIKLQGWEYLQVLLISKKDMSSQ